VQAKILKVSTEFYLIRSQTSSRFLLRRIFGDDAMFRDYRRYPFWGKEAFRQLASQFLSHISACSSRLFWQRRELIFVNLLIYRRQCAIKIWRSKRSSFYRVNSKTKY